METPKKKPRVYRKITPQVMALHRAEALKQGNASAAVRVLEPDEVKPTDRAFRVTNKQRLDNAVSVIDHRLREIGLTAVEELGSLVQHTDAKIRQKSVHYAIDQVRGKALQRSESRNLNVNIQTALDD